MDDMAAQLVINEALYEAGAASFAAIEISELDSRLRSRSR